MTATVNFTVANTVAWKLALNLSRDGSPWDVTDYAARMQLRSPVESDVPAATFTTEAGTLAIVGSTLSIDVPRGVAFGIPAGSYDYDIILLRGNETERPVEGVITVKQGVTR